MIFAPFLQCVVTLIHHLVVKNTTVYNCFNEQFCKSVNEVLMSNRGNSCDCTHVIKTHHELEPNGLFFQMLSKIVFSIKNVSE